nr:ribonuclease H-like domain-containing protein [Tanacetum cinerariifolium]
MTVSTKFLINIVDISNRGLIVGRPNVYTVSLLSVHKLARDSKLIVVFDEYKCYIQDSKEGNIVESGKQSNGLYLFYVDHAYKDSKERNIVESGKQSNGLYLFYVDHAYKVTANNYITKCHVSKSIWHQRLSHPVEQVLLVLKEKLNLDNETISPCDTCHKAKQTREPFPFNNHKATKIGRASFDNDGTELDLLDSKEIDFVATSMEEEAQPKGTGSLTHNHDEMVSGSETDSNSDT